MRKALARIVLELYTWLAKRVVKHHDPTVVAIVGCVGKTTTKDLVAAVLSRHTSVRAAAGSYNSEWGVPLTILGRRMSSSPIGILRTIASAMRLLLPSSKYPEVLVLELGVDHPGDMQRLLKIIQPSVVVVTNTRNTHLQNFQSTDQIAHENRKAVEILPEEGTAILNHDEDPTREMANATAAHVLTYGYDSGSSMRIVGHRFSRSGQTVQLKSSTAADLLTLRTKLLGDQQLYAVAAAVTVGQVLGVFDKEISTAVSEFEGPTGRMRLFAAEDGGIVIDDTYNASPQAVEDSLRILDQLPHPRVAVLGTMGELGDDFESGHDLVGRAAARHADYLVVLGEGGERIAKSAKASGLSVRAITPASSIAEAIAAVKKHSRASTLVKASQALYLERVVIGLIKPEDAPRTLQRLSRAEHQRNLLKAPPEG